MIYTQENASEHTKQPSSLASPGQWVSLANVTSPELADRVFETSLRVDAVDWLIDQLGNEATSEAALDFVNRLGKQAPEIVVETVEHGDIIVEMLESESHLAFIHESAFTVEDPAVLENYDGAAAEGEKPKQVAVFRALQGRNADNGVSGISKNKNFYPGDVAEDLVPMLESRPRMYLDHKPLQPMGRATEDLVSLIEKAWAEDGSSFVKANFETGNPKTEWIWGLIEKFPKEVGVSIHAAVQGRKAKIDGQEVFAVEKIGQLFSLDVVGEPSAGGEFQGFATEKANFHQVEGDANDLPSFTMTSNVIDAEALENLKDELEKHKNRSAFWSIGYMVTELIWQVSINQNTDETTKKKEIDELVKEFGEELGKLDPVAIFGPRGNGAEFEGTEQAETQKTAVQQLQEMFDRAFQGDDEPQREAVETVHPASPQEEQPVEIDAIKALTWEQLIAAGNDAAIQKSADMTESKTEDEETQEGLRLEITDLKKELQESRSTVDGFKLKEAEQVRSAKIAELLGASSLDVADTNHVSETFRTDLATDLAKEDGETLAQARIAEREGLIESIRKAGAVAGNGAPETTLPEDEEETAEVSAFEGAVVVKSENEDDLIANLKAAR